MFYSTLTNNNVTKKMKLSLKPNNLIYQEFIF